jgi:hypothetical protein
MARVIKARLYADKLDGAMRDWVRPFNPLTGHGRFAGERFL